MRLVETTVRFHSISSLTIEQIWTDPEYSAQEQHQWSKQQSCRQKERAGGLHDQDMAMCGPELQLQYQDVSSRRIQMHQLLRTAFANRSRSWISWTLVGHPKCAAPVSTCVPLLRSTNWSTDVPNSMDSMGVKQESPSTGKGLVHPCTVLRFCFSHFAWST